MLLVRRDVVVVVAAGATLQGRRAAGLGVGGWWGRPGAGGGGPAGAGMPGRGGGAGGANAGNRTGNVLPRPFEADTGFAAQLGTERTRLTEELFTSGYAADRLDAIAGLLAASAAAYLSADTLATEKAAISAALG